jgi:hypothetical protein
MKKMEKNLKSSPFYPTNLNNFIEQMKQYLESADEVLIKSLVPVKLSSELSGSQDPESLLRILLNIGIVF